MFPLILIDSCQALSSTGEAKTRHSNLDAVSWVPNRRGEKVLWFAACTLANTAPYSSAFFTSHSSCSNALSSFSVNLHPVSSQPALLHGDILSWHRTGHFPLLNSTSFLQTHISSLSTSLRWTAGLLYQSGRAGLQACKLCSLQTCWEYTLSLFVCKGTKQYGLYYQYLVRWHWQLPARGPLHCWSQTFKPKVQPILHLPYLLRICLKDAVGGLQTLVDRASHFILKQSGQLSTNCPC